MSSEWFLRIVWAVSGGGFLAAVPSRPAQFGWVDATVFALLGLALLAPALPGFPRSGEAPTARADADAVVVSLTLRHRLARAVMWGGFAMAAAVVTAASGSEDALWEIAVGAAITLLLAWPASRAVRALADDRVGALLLTPEGVSLDGGRRWTTWADLTFVMARRYPPHYVQAALVLERSSGRGRTRIETALPLRADALQTALRQLQRDPSRLAGPVGVEAFRSALT